MGLTSPILRLRLWSPACLYWIGNALEAAGAADWLTADSVTALWPGVGAVLGFVPQMLVVFLMLAFLEACG